MYRFYRYRLHVFRFHPTQQSTQPTALIHEKARASFDFFLIKRYFVTIMPPTGNEAIIFFQTWHAPRASAVNAFVALHAAFHASHAEHNTRTSCAGWPDLQFDDNRLKKKIGSDGGKNIKVGSWATHWPLVGWVWTAGQSQPIVGRLLLGATAGKISSLRGTNIRGISHI